MILIVDDDPSVVASLELLLKQHGQPSESAVDPRGALERLERRRYDLVLQDMNFSRSTTGEEGLELLARARALRPDVPVILMTAWGSIALAVEGIKRGAADFITKPWTNAQLLQAVETALSLADARREMPRASPPTRRELEARLDLHGLVGEDPQFLRILEVIGRVAPTDASVLITGESGTGKELVADAIHRNSRRAGRPFVKVNLGGIASTLFESEMFGHVRGAFTDARVDRKGRFEVADGGTIFLDEIGDLDPSSQVKLLRVLQDRTYEVLGSSRPRSVDVRVISATNRDLAEAVDQGRFREDLLYRLNLITVRLPALRERPEDIPRLAGHFLQGLARVYRRTAPRLEEGALDWLRARPWPGNVRQLRQTLERAVLIQEGDRLGVEDLLALEGLDGEGGGRSAPLPAVGAMTLEEMERAMITKCVRHYEGNLSRVAEALGLSRPSLYRRLKKYGIDVEVS
ncbi:MAG: sigma-54 dependent transcriptional regulator [Acidobacteriota bacterium]|jgi:DNA-binding NtrC family response regulator